MDFPIQPGCRPTATPPTIARFDHPLFALTADASAFTFQSPAPLGTQLMAGGQQCLRYARAFLERHPWIPTAGLFGIGAAAFALSSHEAGTMLMAMGSMGHRSERFHTLPSLPADSPLRRESAHQALLQENQYGRLYEGLLAAWADGPAAYDRLVQALPWYHDTRRQLETAGIDLGVWGKGIAPRSQLISEAMRAEAPLESHRRLWELWFEQTLQHLRRPQNFFRKLCAQLGLDLKWIPQTGIDNFKRLLDAGLANPPPEAPAAGLRLLRPAPDPLEFLVRLGAAIHGQSSFGVRLQYFQVGLPGRHIVVETVPKIPTVANPLLPYFVFSDAHAKIYREFLPYTLTDPATHIVGIRSGDTWIAAALLIAARDEHGRPVMILDELRVDDTYLSVSSNTQREIQRGFYEYILMLERTAGFACTAMHRPTDSQQDFPPRPFQFATKIHTKGQPFRSARFQRLDRARQIAMEGGDLATVEGTLQFIQYQGLSPHEYLFRSALKNFSETSCKTVLEAERGPDNAAQRIRYLQHQFPEAWHLCEDKPVRPEFVENLGMALRYGYAEAKKRLDFCLRRQDEPWHIAMERMLAFMMFISEQRRRNGRY